MIHLCMMPENIWQIATFESDGFTWNIIQCWVNLPSQKNANVVHETIDSISVCGDTIRNDSVSRW